jgi:maltodextrin utilization protein YvdJ
MKKQTLNEQIGRIKSIMNINEDDSEQMAALQQATQEFNEKAEEELTPDDLQEVACTQPDSVELPSNADEQQKQKFEEFKMKVKQMVAAKDIAGLKQAKRQLKELKNQSKQQQNEQAVTGALYTVIGIQMPLGFVIFTYGFLLLLILNGLLSLFGIHLIKTITYWCTGRRSTGFGLRFGRD